MAQEILPDGAEGTPWAMILAAFASSFIGIGLARFAYTPLIPALVSHGWFTDSAAFYLGAANLAGYLAGALLAPALVRRLGGRLMLRLMMALASLSFFACAVPLSFAWFFVWRVLSGLTGGVLMVSAAPAVLPHVPARLRGQASGAIFTGVGLGALLSGTLIPVLLRLGLPATWTALGLVSTALCILTWWSWPDYRPAPDTAAPPAPGQARALRRLYACYGLDAAALVPHMVFLVAFVDSAAGHGFAAGAMAWSLFGLGAMAGPFTLGALADRLGFSRILRLGFAVQFLAIGALALTHAYPVILISAFIGGAFTPGIAPLTLGRVREILHDAPHRQHGAWSRATASFAVMQAVGAYGLSWLFSQTRSYPLLFALGAACVLLALAVDLLLQQPEERAARSKDRSEAPSKAPSKAGPPA